MGIAGIHAGLKWIEERGFDQIEERFGFDKHIFVEHLGLIARLDAQGVLSWNVNESCFLKFVLPGVTVSKGGAL